MADGPAAGPPPATRVAVVGLGLIGGSLALALARRGVEVLGHDLPAPLGEAAARRLAVPAATLEEAVAGAEAVFLAAPLDQLHDLALAALAAAPQRCVVSDVGSLKAELVAAIDDPRFIGGHPLAGGEQAGAAAARADLFDGATWYLTPRESCSGVLFERLHRLLCSIGATPVTIEASRHDRLMAATSHLPHLLANALVEQAVELGESDPQLAPLLAGAVGPSFREATRVAGANSGLWASIFAANRQELMGRLRVVGEALGRIEGLLASGSLAELERYQRRVGLLRSTLYAGLQRSEQLEELQLRVANRPGVVAQVALALGNSGINIHNLALNPDPDNRAGLLCLWVERGQAARARELLAALGL